MLNVTLNLVVDLYQNKTTEMETICERESCAKHVEELRETCFIGCEFVVLEWLKMFEMLFGSRRMIQGDHLGKEHGLSCWKV